MSSVMDARLQLVIEICEREAKRHSQLAIEALRGPAETSHEAMETDATRYEYLAAARAYSDIASLMRRTFEIPAPGHYVTTLSAEQTDQAVVTVPPRVPESHEPGCDSNYGSDLCSCSPYGREQR